MEQSLPKGKLKIHSEKTGIVNARGGQRTVAETTKKLNSPENLDRTFYQPNNPRILHAVDFEDGAQVRLYNQTGKYSEISAMVIAKGPDTFNVPAGETAPTETIYDYPTAAQETYWQLVMGTMSSFKKNNQVEGMRVFAGENCIATYSNETHRTSRSIANPHMHIVGLIEDHIETNDVENIVPGLDSEQELAAWFVPNIKNAVQDELAETRQEKIILEPRDSAPFGYTFQVPGELEKLMTNPAKFSSIMNAHHVAYTKAAKKFEKENTDKLFRGGDNQVIPQPSYRLYLEHTGKNMHVTISPEFLSHAGVMEAAGIMLNRNEENPTRISNEIVKQAQQEAVDEIQMITLFEAKGGHYERV